MISIIICSRNNNLPKVLKDNISETIGVDYELVVIDNSENKYSIFSAYNEGVRKAKGDILCFMHDDVLFHTENWGKLVYKYFRDDKVGLIGILGSHYLPKAPSYWTFTNMYSGEYLQDYLENGIVKTKIVSHAKFNNDKNLMEVVAVDGLWYCIPRKLFSKISYDEINFSGFHGYDMDISLQVRKAGLKVLIVFDILVEHANIGGISNYNLLVENILKLNTKWKSELPQYAGIKMTQEELDARETDMMSYFELVLEYNRVVNEKNRILKSKSYRLGKLILKPFSKIKNS